MNELGFNQPGYTGPGARLRLPSEADRQAALWRAAGQMFWRSHAQARTRYFWSHLLGRPRSLYDLNQLGSACEQHYGGLRSVDVYDIRGSEGRCADFDQAFRPLHSHMHDRWTGVAHAVLLGVALPAVHLIQVGDVYFVRDGHHRVSVARTWGQQYIDAEVCVWEMPHPLPWAEVAPVRAHRFSLRGSIAL